MSAPNIFSLQPDNNAEKEEYQAELNRYDELLAAYKSQTGNETSERRLLFHTRGVCESQSGSDSMERPVIEFWDLIEMGRLLKNHCDKVNGPAFQQAENMALAIYEYPRPEDSFIEVTENLICPADQVSCGIRVQSATRYGRNEIVSTTVYDQRRQFKDQVLLRVDHYRDELRRNLLKRAWLLFSRRKPPQQPQPTWSIAELPRLMPRPETATRTEEQKLNDPKIEQMVNDANLPEDLKAKLRKICNVPAPVDQPIE